MTIDGLTIGQLLENNVFLFGLLVGFVIGDLLSYKTSSILICGEKMKVLKNIRNELLILSVIPEIIYHVCRYEINKNYKWSNEMLSKYAKWVIKEINDEK